MRILKEQKVVVQNESIDEIENEGLIALLGKNVTLFSNYIYTGKLIGVNKTCVKLTNAKIVYQTGVLDNNKWEDAQKLPNDWYVQISQIESFGILNKE